MNPVTPTLDPADRKALERTILRARTVAEAAATAALARLGVNDARVPDHLTEAERAMRRRLRARARSLGDLKGPDDSQAVDHLVAEVAYEHWHRMLFSRYLAEAGLLLWEPGVAVSLADCDELVRDPDTRLGARSAWDLAGRLAARMLPAIFKPENPAFAVVFAPEHQHALEALLIGLPAAVFQASDGLGWVYQYWQAQRKEAINRSEVKIGADELPAVTQLFTEPYMVDFLLHNSLGAWWVTRHPDSPCPVPLPYLRLREDGTPATGRLEGWPEHLRTFKLLDPCCGSGHFLVAAFHMLVPMRMAAEGLDAATAVDAVLAENLHGLELDARCVEIAVFALALAAWRYPDASGRPLGVRPGMPTPGVACSGLPVQAPVEAWVALAPDGDEAQLAGLRALHETFSQAPVLGSLLDPVKLHRQDTLLVAGYDRLRETVHQALASEAARAGSENGSWDVAVGAAGLLEAAALLEGRYDLVVTNVPYLNRAKQAEALRTCCEARYAEAKADLANVFLARCHELARKHSGLVQVVMPQNWLFLGTYKQQRMTLLKSVTWNLVARLGEGGFDSPQAAGAFTILLTQTRAEAPAGFEMVGIDASAPRTPGEKADVLRAGDLVVVEQRAQLGNPDARVVLAEEAHNELLSGFSAGLAGVLNGDSPRFLRSFWEVRTRRDLWSYQQTTHDSTIEYGGLQNLIFFDEVAGHLREEEWIRRERLHNSDQRGQSVVGKLGVAISSMRALPAARFTGTRFDSNVAAIVPHDPTHLPAIWCYCSSPDYHEAVRRIDQKLNVTNATLVKVPFDLAHWQAVAARRYPHGLPEPHSDDPTQWLFHGHPCGSVVWEEARTEADGTVAGGVLRHGPLRVDDTVLQVAVARLLGYRWPAETDPTMALSAESREWVGRCAALDTHVDDDGILCLPAVRGESPAADRLLALLIDAYETASPGTWRPALLDRLLSEVGFEGKGLAAWLRDGFFEQHCKRFGHRPFVWHVWDGLKDGFGALVNYHRLDARTLERLIHTYLGDWISQQEAAVTQNVDGATTRLAAARDLQRRLMLIQEGEAPYDLFVRWKPLEAQPLGWDPDLDDGVRLNIRPWVTAGVLRHVKKPRLNLHWEKDRGKDVESAPWFHRFQGDRINDHHTTLAEKRAARGLT